METSVVKPHLARSIDICKLTLGDWEAIASICCNSDRPFRWAYFKWVENTDSDLSELSLEDWESIAEDCDFNPGWAYHRYKENKN